MASNTGKVKKRTQEPSSITAATSRASKNAETIESQAQNDRAARKRVQNRISQKCIREKQLAQSQHLASFLDLIQASRKGGDGSQTALIESHLKLLEENQKMKTSLLRMRKKMLSLSNSARTTAGKLSLTDQVVVVKHS